jgi:hypothetical protein
MKKLSFGSKLKFGPKRRKPNFQKSPDVRLWVVKAIASEAQQDPAPLWWGAPSANDAHRERTQRIRFLRKYRKTHPTAKLVSERLASCDPKHRCMSGACPECGRLLQRCFVRQSRPFICREIDKKGTQLVALNIVPPRPVVKPGTLQRFSVADLQRRIKFALDQVGIGNAIGGIDFSFNEDRDGKYSPFWSVHAYLITATDDRVGLRKRLRKLRPQFKRTKRVRRPIKVSPFENSRRRRSYALKMAFKRRIGYDEIKLTKDGEPRERRNTSKDKLRAIERIELFLYLDQIGLAERVFFRGGKPVISAGTVRIKATGSSYQANGKKHKKRR